MSKRKTVRPAWPGFREISTLSRSGEVYGGKDLRKKCVLSLEEKEEWLMVIEVVMTVWI